MIRPAATIPNRHTSLMVLHVPTSISAVLLDIDGVLVDHRSAADEAARRWAPTLPGWSPAVQDPAQRWEDLDRHHFTRYQHGELDFTGQLRARVRDFVPAGASLTDAQADAHMAAYRAIYRTLWTSYDDVTEFLDRLAQAQRARNLAVAYLTNGEKSQQIDKMGSVGVLRDWPILASAQLGATKPSPQIFHTACQHLGVQPASALMIGDDAWADVDGALGAGMSIVHLRRDPQAPARDVPTVTTLADIRFE